ncbi:hypothetical protein D7X33_15300, partial [Butyricicoccus sp. 1XD8-22]
NILLIRSPLSFYITRFPIFLFRSNIYNYNRKHAICPALFLKAMQPQSKMESPSPAKQYRQIDT